LAGEGASRKKRAARERTINFGGEWGISRSGLEEGGKKTNEMTMEIASSQRG